MPNIKLLSSDGDIFEVDVDIAKQSVVVKTMLEGLGLDEGEDEAVPLPNVNAGILKKVIQWCTYHKDDPLPSEDDENKEKRTDDICSWDTEFLKVDEGTLFELIMAADYLDIKGLLDVTCKTVANMIKGKTPEEIRKIFNIKNDFTPPGEKQLFAAATTMPQTPEDDEQRKIDLASAFQNEDQMRCAKFTLPTATTLLDLPMELQEHILLEVITSEVRDRKLLRGAWKGLADRIAERMRNVCPQWDSALTSEAFRNRLHGILDSFPHVEFCFNVLARHRFFGCVNVAALNDELFVLCQQWHQHAHIDVYAHDDLQTAKRTIELRGVTMPWKLVACSMTNALYVLHQVSSNTEICRVSIDEHEIQASPWIACPSKLISRMSVSADGSLILFQGPAPSTVKVFNVDGSLQHEIELVNHVSYLHDVLSKSNGNFLLVKKKTLAEVDREGKTVCEYDKASGQFIYCALDIHDRIVMINDGGAVRLLDSEFNSVNNVKFRLESYKGSTKHFYQVQYNRKRNEFIAFESAAFSGAGAGQCLTVFNFTERSIPDGAQNEQNEQNSDSDADSNSDADSSSDADTNSD